jgi:AcrR family transcriptional regulator
MQQAPAEQISTPTKQRLLAATETLVVREGVMSLSVRRIASEANVNSALIRYHFGDVAGLLAELARLNAAQLREARDLLLDALEASGEQDFGAAVDALVLPLWAPAAMAPDERAIVVIDELYSRAGPALNALIWREFELGVRRVTAALGAALGNPDEADLTWRIRFVTAAALDIPPRSPGDGDQIRGPIAMVDTSEQRLAQFQRFARQALRDIGGATGC